MTTNRRWLAAALGIWLAAALAVHPVPAQAAQSQQNADATLRIVNESEQEICYVYLSLTTASTWGDDWLGNDTILPGESYSFSLVSGEYDVKLVDCRGNELLVRWYLALSNSHELSYSGADPCLASNQEGYRLYVQARYAEALQRFEWALACFREVGDRAGEGNVLSNIGRVYYGQGRYGEALDYYQQALAIRREVGDRANEGTTLNNIGLVYNSQGRYGEALDYYQQALAIRREVGDRANEGTTLNNIGGVYHDQGRYGEALDYYQQALAIRREVGDRAGEGITLNNIGLVYRHQGWYGEALDYYQQALAIGREVGDRAGEGITLNNIGLVYDNQGRYGEALDYYQQALAIVREVGDRVAEGATLNNIGAVYDSQGRYGEALDYYQQALAIRREVGDRANEGTTLNNIGLVYNSQGRYGEALDYHQQALAIGREVGDRAGEGLALNNIGGVYYRQGRYGEALDYYQQALAIRRKVGDRAGEGATLNNIGGVYHDQGRYGEAVDCYQQALAIGREVGDRAGEGATLNNIGGVYHDQGRYGEAVDCYRQALAIGREVGDRAGEGLALNNIGGVYYRQGRYGEALDYYQQALAIGREVGDRAGEGATLSNIGLVYGDQGRYGEALDYYQQALAIGREVGDRAGEGTTLNNIGLVYYHQGRYAKALDYYQQALAIVREVGDRAGEGTTLNNIGAVYRGQGRYGEALDYCQQALAIVREVGDRAGEGINLNDIGLVYGDQGRYGEALDYYEQAMEVFESLRTVAGSEAGRAGFIAQYADLYQRTVALYHQQGQDAQAFQTSERGRARVFLDSLATGHVELSDQQAATLLAREQETYAARQAAQDALAAARAFVPPDPPLVAGLEAQLAAAEQQHAAALAAIETRGDQLAALVPGRGAVPELADVQALLPDQTALLSYQDLSDQGTLAFILTRDSFTVVNLPQATPTNLRTAIDDLYQWLNRDNPHPLPLQKLHAWLVAPLAQHLHTPFVGLIPHQLLHYVPFAALTDGETYFGQQHILFTLPSASALPFIQANASDTPGTGALVFGNPETEEPGLLPLLRSAAEAQAVAEGLGAAVYTGREASEARLRRQVGGRGVVHLAAHGGYNVVAPLYSAIHLAPGDGQDGRLEAHEVYGLDLGQTDLVVLSACRSNVGELSAGDELVGLTRAFFYAGAPTVIASLWSVDDAATEKLMVAFYRQWREGMGKAEALQAAQAEVQKTHPGPFYWAAFVLSGDPGQVSPTAQPTEPSPTPSPTQPAPTPTGTPSAGKGDGLCGSTAMLPLALILLAFTQDRGSRKPGQPRHMR